MCGIIGYTGFKPAAEKLLLAISKLENRGYDSCGVVLIGGETTKSSFRKRIVGTTQGAQALKEGTNWEKYQQYTQGIGHTRWATHGDATEANAHPHQSEDIWVVHNGQIENYEEIKKILIEEGYFFASDTDTEVVPHLIHSYRSKGKSITEAIKSAFKDLTGAFGLVIGVDGDDCIYAITQTSPLVLGFAEHGHFVGSTTFAFPGEVNTYSAIPDHVLMSISPSGIAQEYLRETTPRVASIDMDRIPLNFEVKEAYEKGGYSSFMEKEIMEQPMSLAATLRGRIKEGILSLGGVEHGREGLINDLLEADQIVFLACGTSYFAACEGAMLFEKHLGIRSRAEIGSEFELKKPLITSRDVVIGISQSGETADTIAGLKYARSKGATILGICNTAGSVLVRLTDAGVLLHAGPEMSVASTKAFTSQVTVLYLLTLLLAKYQGISLDWATAVEYIPRQIERLLGRFSPKKVAQYLATKDSVFIIGRELDYPVAQEIALKIKEVSYLHAEAFAAGEMKHGTYALIEEGTPCIVLLANLCPKIRSKMLNQLAQLKSRKAFTIVIHDIGDEEVAKHSDMSIEMEPTDPELRIISNTVVGQLIAHATAKRLRREIDRPRNLAKTVTVE